MPRLQVTPRENRNQYREASVWLFKKQTNNVFVPWPPRGAVCPWGVSLTALGAPREGRATEECGSAPSRGRLTPPCPPHGVRPSLTLSLFIFWFQRHRRPLFQTVGVGAALLLEAWGRRGALSADQHEKARAPAASCPGPSGRPGPRPRARRGPSPALPTQPQAEARAGLRQLPREQGQDRPRRETRGHRDRQAGRGS